MNLEIMQEFAQMKLDLYKAQQEIENLQIIKVLLEKDLAEAATKERLRECFEIYNDSLYVKDIYKISLVKYLTASNSDKPQTFAEAVLGVTNDQV